MSLESKHICKTGTQLHQWLTEALLVWLLALVADPYTLWRVDSSLSEGEVAWPQATATAQDIGWGDTEAVGPPWSEGAGRMQSYGYGYGYESEGEVQPGTSSAPLSPGCVL